MQNHHKSPHCLGELQNGAGKLSYSQQSVEMGTGISYDVKALHLPVNESNDYAAAWSFAQLGQFLTLTTHISTSASVTRTQNTICCSQSVYDFLFVGDIIFP